jgi:hypothetical protein
MEWKTGLPNKAGFYLMARNVLQPHTNENHNNVYKDEIEIIFYFKERNVTGWQKDWTAKPSNVKYWMPLPIIPT